MYWIVETINQKKLNTFRDNHFYKWFSQKKEVFVSEFMQILPELFDLFQPIASGILPRRMCQKYPFLLLVDQGQSKEIHVD